MAQRTRLVVAALATLLASSPFVTRAQEPAPPPLGQQGGPPPQGQHRPIPKPVNLKVFPKDIAPEELIRIMRGFNGQLGVRCEFCHAEDPATHRENFASDEKPTKDIARSMILMTRDINAKYLSTITVPNAQPAEREATCGTCHRGMPIPAVFQPAGPPHTAPPPTGPAGPPPQS